MRLRPRPMSVALAALAALLSLATAAVAAGGVALKTLDGKHTSLAGQVSAGRWTLVMMWTTYCGVCRRQYPVLSTFHDRHQGTDATVLGIALDGYAALPDVRDYVARRPFSYPTVVGEADAVGAAFEQATGDPFTGTPSYLLFNPERQLVAAIAGELTIDALEEYLARPRP